MRWLHITHKNILHKRDKRQVHIEAQGVVQGVGFRPFVYSIARELGLDGHVENTGAGVEIVVRGGEQAVARFIEALRNKPPPLARIGSISVRESEAPLAPGFSIRPSRDHQPAATLISPDIATCDDCLADIFSRRNRRYFYPFTNCTNCGPRMTIIARLPYDRANTSMRAFTMCPACRREYDNPDDRRFHAQPNACPHCGPSLAWRDHNGSLLCDDSTRALQECARALAAGKIVAIRGLGGFHLAVDAASEQAVTRLRRRKRRPAKPLAVMVADLDTPPVAGRINRPERELLTSRERPIVLCRLQDSGLCRALAPGLAETGIMLPATPLHHLLFSLPDCPKALVMTSGNPSGEPICTDNDEACARLAGIADFFLTHNREILTRVDDAVARVTAGRVQMIRRARGYAPLPVPLAAHLPPLLACGAELKNTFCLTRGDQAFISQHIGDLKGPDTLAFFEQSIRYFRDILEISPQAVVRDLHPDYLSSRHAEACGLPCTAIQHHHAHAGAVMAEHHLDQGLAVIFDGAGLGPDRTIWGGEFLLVRGPEWTRAAHLSPFPLPGGDAATRETWRIAIALLRAAGTDIAEPGSLPATLQTVPDPARIRDMEQVLASGINSPRCSSMGRLFDGIASLLGLRHLVEYEGQAAMELEDLAHRPCRAVGEHGPDDSRYRATLSKGPLPCLDMRPLVRWICDDLQRGVPVRILARCFHLWLVRSTVAMIDHLTGADRSVNILLGGGCFQNRILSEMLRRELEELGYRVYSGGMIPVNDGGISLGQAWLAGLAMLDGRTRGER